MVLSPRHKLVSALAAAGLTLALSAQSADAQYYHRRGPSGGAVAAGVIGGLAVGALAAGAASRPYYGPAYGYGYPAYGAAPVYVEPGPVCYFEREDVWNGYGYVPRRVRVCR